MMENIEPWQKNIIPLCQLALGTDPVCSFLISVVSRPSRASDPHTFVSCRLYLLEGKHVGRNFVARDKNQNSHLSFENPS
jgi:hypothetical protein